MSIHSGPQIEHGSRKAVYLDYAATTPVDPQVIEVMIQCLGLDGIFGNAASRSHRFGKEAKEAKRTSNEKGERDVFCLAPSRPNTVVPPAFRFRDRRVPHDRIPNNRVMASAWELDPDRRS